MARPRVPAPTTATTSSAWMSADKAACTAQAVGSTITASSSEKASGTWWIWEGWATRPAVDQPPPVSAQKPVCSPGARSPKATCGQSPLSPRAHHRQGGRRCRGTQPSTGSMTTRVPGIERLSGVIAPGRFRHRGDLVAGDEGEADQILEVAGAAPVESGEVRPADARQERPKRDPVVGRAAREARGRGGGGARCRRPVPSPWPMPSGPRRSAGGCARRRGPSSRRLRCRTAVPATGEDGVGADAGGVGDPSRAPPVGAGWRVEGPEREERAGHHLPPAASARRASPAVGRWRPAWPRGSRPRGSPPPRAWPGRWRRRRRPWTARARGPRPRRSRPAREPGIRRWVEALRAGRSGGRRARRGGRRRCRRTMAATARPRSRGHR